MKQVTYLIALVSLLAGLTGCADKKSRTGENGGR